MELHSAREKLDSMERKLSYLKDRYMEAWKDYGTSSSGEAGNGTGAERAVQDARRSYDLYVERYDQFRQQAKHARTEALRILHIMELLECVELLDLDEGERSFIQQKLRKKLSLPPQFPHFFPPETL